MDRIRKRADRRKRIADDGDRRTARDRKESKEGRVRQRGRAEERQTRNVG